jgi:hypothetical protein
MLHNCIISSIIPENNTPFRLAVTEELHGNEICHFANIWPSNNIFYANEEINIQTNYTNFILFTQLTYV